MVIPWSKNHPSHPLEQSQISIRIKRMDTLKQAPCQHLALEKSLLGRLPPKLILEIADCLPPENAMLFLSLLPLSLQQDRC
jgi:hypothetical protein